MWKKRTAEMKRIFVLGMLTLSFVGNALAYYQAEQGRWLNRDPIGERGGLGVYVSGNNTLINAVDILGLTLKCKTKKAQEILDNLEKNGTEHDNENINQLRDSKNPHTITTRDSTFPGSSKSTPNNLANAYNGNGTGTDITIELNSRTSFSPESTLSHEVDHSADSDRGESVPDDPTTSHDEGEQGALAAQRAYQNKNGEKVRKNEKDDGSECCEK